MTCLIEANDAAYRYADGRVGLQLTSLAVEAGERVHISGPSGCGKSTLARCLTGVIPHLYRGTLSGSIDVCGLCTGTTPLWQLAERAGLVFQNPASQMLATSVEEEVLFGLENLGLPREVVRERLEAVLVQFGLTALRKRAPQTLSGGEQQKLALAAIMARQPPVLVLDEPLSMLDTTASLDLVAHLADLAHSGTAVVVCEHRCEYLAALPQLRTIELDGPALDVPAFSEVPPPVSGVAPFRLDVSGLGVRLGGRSILHGLSFSMPGGQVVALVGRNGVGKTTLLRALAGLQKHEGAVQIDGEPPDLGIVFQNPDVQLFNATVREEVLYRLADPDKGLYAWLVAALGLTPYEHAPPLLLSEGEKKRVALATVLMRQPRHGVLLDEPALGQDARHKSMLIGLARSLAARGKLVVIATHDLALAAQADRLLLLGPQGIVADGTPGAVLTDDAPWTGLGLAVPDWIRASSRHPRQAATVEGCHSAGASPPSSEAPVGSEA